MLIILIAACKSARTAFEAADNVVDSQNRAGGNQQKTHTYAHQVNTPWR